MSEPLCIRRATRADLSQLEQLEQRCFTTDRMSRRSILSALSSASSQVWLVEDGSSGILASAVLFYRKDSSVCRLYSLAVDPSARGKGLSVQLLRVLECAAVERCCSVMRLEVRTDNSAAIGLYTKSGYHRFGEITGFYEDGSNALRMQKTLR